MGVEIIKRLSKVFRPSFLSVMFLHVGITRETILYHSQMWPSYHTSPFTLSDKVSCTYMGVKLSGWGLRELVGRTRGYIARKF